MFLAKSKGMMFMKKLFKSFVLMMLQGAMLFLTFIFAVTFFNFMSHATPLASTIGLPIGFFTLGFLVNKTFSDVVPAKAKATIETNAIE